MSIAALESVERIAHIGMACSWPSINVIIIVIMCWDKDQSQPSPALSKLTAWGEDGLLTGTQKNSTVRLAGGDLGRADHLA